MLTIELPQLEVFDNQTMEFITYPPAKLLLEHSLRSISKWEGKWHTPFPLGETMTNEEFLDYVRCMTTNPQKDMTVYFRIGQKEAKEIIDYMQDSHTAKTFYDKPKPRIRIKQTAEDYYRAMAYYGIPFECENWHFGRLTALLKTCESNGGSGEKMTYREQQAYYRQINDMRRKKLGTKG